LAVYYHTSIPTSHDRRDSRLAKLDAADGPYTAIILAKAGLVRYGAGHRITADIPAPTMYYAVSQGALAIEIRSDDVEARSVLQTLVHQPTEWMCSAERSFLRILEGGCTVPVGINSSLAAAATSASTLTLTGCITSLNGEVHVQHTLVDDVRSREDAEAAGERLAHVLMETGAKKILDEVAADRARRTGEAKTETEVQKIEAAMDGAVQA
jgi:hydroxymethylbilane synthase